MREEIHFFFPIFCLKLIKNLNLDIFDGSSFISDKYLTVCFMEEHEQLNLNKFILKSHLSWKVEGETLRLISLFQIHGKERIRMAKWFRAREMQSPGPTSSCCVTLGRRLPLSALASLSAR